MGQPSRRRFRVRRAERRCPRPFKIAPTTEKRPRGDAFIFCPCHLPVSTAVRGMVFGGGAFGTLVGRNTISVGITFGVIYMALLAAGDTTLPSASAMASV